MPFLKGRTDAFEILPNQRYDRMFELMDCHGEHVERPEKFRPSLERALRAGKTALVNVVGDRAIGIRTLAEICSARPACSWQSKVSHCFKTKR
jgi:thiamine pyrophosphate-dependent acetolactate synthase large subunit-like protein